MATSYTSRGNPMTLPDFIMAQEMELQLRGDPFETQRNGCASAVAEPNHQMGSARHHHLSPPEAVPAGSQERARS
jgi:hypothetical protein